MAASFAHLHVHTEYSLLDGMSRIKDLVSHTAELGMDSLAITDHGAMYGVIEFYRACKDEGIKPIIGLETYMSPRGMGDRESKIDSQNYHLLLLAHNQVGYQNLLKIASASQLEGFYYKPRIDKEFLAAHSEGLVCTTGCLAAEIPQMLMEGRDKEARQMIGWYQDVFGPDRFYVELQDHDIPELHQLNKALLEISPHVKVPLLATNDVHYVRKTDADPHDVLLCIGTGSLVSEKKRLRFSDASYYLRSPAEMVEIFGEVPESLSNSLKIAEMCDVNLDHKEYHIPVFPVPEGYDAQSFLRSKCEEGVVYRYSADADTERVRSRLEYELQVIHDMGFDNYFLIVSDLCDAAREKDIWWNVRGSGAGCIVAYCLGITMIDPLENNLIFERFLNPGRVSMPDIDIDYPDDRRAEMIEYCVAKYGEDKVAQIITFGTLGARAAVRDVARALDVPLNEVDQLARLIPAIPGKPVTLAEAMQQVPELKKAYEDKERPYLKKMMDTAMQLEGISRHASTHAAGVLIADRPLVEYTPLNRPTKGGEKNDKNSENGESSGGLNVVSQWPMAIVESIGLLKVDFLGLRTLTIMRKACELIEQNHGIKYDLNSIPYRHRSVEDEYNERLDEAFALMSKGETSGVFQVEGGGMTRVLTEMRPSRFEHIIAAISLFRPGPIEYIPAYIRRMHGDEPVSYHHPLLEPILGETYGICISGDSVVIEARTGKRYRVDEIGGLAGEFTIQGVDADYKPAIGRVTHWIDNGVKPVYRLTLRNGSTIKATIDHKFLTEYGWRELKDLQVGDYVGVPSQLVEPEQLKALEIAYISNHSPVTRDLPGALPRTLALGDTDWDEIVSIEPAGEERVYDLTVEGLHNFVANNIIVHNCVYQEQIQQIAADLFGYSLGDADLMRRAVSKKKEKDLLKHRSIFQKNGPARGVPEDAAGKIFDDIEFFARYGFNKCVGSSTEIVDATTGRIVTIGDLHSGKVKIDKTLSLSIGNLRLQQAQITDVMYNGVKPVYRLTTRTGRQIEATDNHPFYTFNGWRNLGELATGDRIAIPRCITVEGQKEWPEHEVIVLGHLLAEGNLCHPNGIYYYTGDDEQWRDYVTHLEKFDNTVATTHIRRGNMHDVYGKRNNRSYPTGVMQWIENLGLRKTDSYTKFIPDEVFELRNRQIALLVARMWEGDGHINEKGRSAYYATSSERMARQLQHLFLRLSIVTRLRKVVFPYKDGRTGYQVFVTGNENLGTFLKLVGCYFVSRERIEKLQRITSKPVHVLPTHDTVPVEVMSIIQQERAALNAGWVAVANGADLGMRTLGRSSGKTGYSRDTISTLAEYFDSDELRHHADNDIYWDSVVSIEYIGEQPTYDLTIADTHNFVANDIIVHNSHAADYAVLTVQTAFLKAHYPEEFMAALLTIERGDTAKVGGYINDCRRMNIQVLPPEINTSGHDFVIEPREDGTRSIRYGLSAIKNVGEGSVEAIIDSRKAAPFKDIADFSQRVDLRVVGKRALESLIKVGALDDLGGRGSLLASLERIVGFSANQHRAADVGQMSLFGDSTGVSLNSASSGVLVTEAAQELNRKEMLQWERELVGVYISEHPLQSLMERIGHMLTGFTNQITDADHDRFVTMAGMIISVRRHMTKSGKAMAFAQMEDLYGQIEVVIWPRTWDETQDLWAPDRVLLVRGKLDCARGDPKLLCEEATTNLDFHEAVADDRTTDRAWQPLYVPQEYDTDTQDAPPPPDDDIDVWRSLEHAAPDASDRIITGNGTDVFETDSDLVEDSIELLDLPEMDEEAPAAEIAYAAPVDPYEKFLPRFGEEPVHLYVYVERSDDAERDKRRLRRIHGTLTSFPGSDTFSIVLQEGDGFIEFEFPEDTTRYCAELADQLTAITGVGEIKSDMQQGSPG